MEMSKIKTNKSWEKWAEKYVPIYHKFIDNEGIERTVEVTDYVKGAIECGAMKITLRKYMKENIDRKTGKKTYKDCIQYYFVVTQQKNPEWKDEWHGKSRYIKEDGSTRQIYKYNTYKLNEYEARLKKESRQKYAAEKNFERLANQGE